MPSPLKVIHVEDSTSDSELIKEMLRSEGWECDFTRVQTKDELIHALETGNSDLILSDNTLPQFHGMEALKIARSRRPDLPFIFVSGTIGEDNAIRSLQEGATDYVLKNRLSRLVPAMRRALLESESRRARTELEGQLRQARKLETLGTLAGGLAHDFRNLLQAIKMGVAMLPLKSTDPEVLKIAEQLNKATDRGTGLMQELLVFARQTNLNKTSIDLSQLIQETIQIVKPVLSSNVKVNFHPSTLPPIMGDKGQIDRILTNLIMNANDAMPEGGSINLTVDVIAFKEASNSPWKVKETPYIRLQVADTGSGMNSQTLARIFEPFYTTKPAGKGTGLGLAVVFGLMESHEGMIEVNSSLGKGTVFILFFPICSTNSGVQATEIDLPKHLWGEVSSTLH